MKVVILAGGLGTRMAEETSFRPKPMVEVGGRPILWHIMKTFGAQGFTDFVLCLGYKGYMIKEYFVNYYLHQSDCTVHLQENRLEFHRSDSEPWRVSLIDTGTDTMTGGRIRRVREYVDDGPFWVTYGDGLADVSLSDISAFHLQHGGGATVTAVQPPGRFGALTISSEGMVEEFSEKPRGDGQWINGGYFIFDPSLFSYLKGDADILEQAPLRRMTEDGQLYAYRHRGFWHPMDTLRDRTQLEELWASGKAPWKTW